MIDGNLAALDAHLSKEDAEYTAAESMSLIVHKAILDGIRDDTPEMIAFLAAWNRLPGSDALNLCLRLCDASREEIDF